MAAEQVGAVDDREHQPKSGSEANRKKQILAMATVLILIVAVIVLYEAARYIGLFAWASEWQFETFGQWLPAFTFIFFIVVPAALVTLVAWLFLRGNRQKPDPRTQSRETWEMRANKFRVLAERTAMGLLAGALLILLLGVLAMRSGEPVRLVETGAAAPATTQAERTIAGQIDREHTTTLAFDLLAYRRDVRYAPVFAPGKPGEISYFAVVDDAGLNLGNTGELRVYDGKVPGPVLILYQRLGYPLAKDVSLIDASSITVQWPYFTAAAHLAIAALVAFILGRIQRRRIAKTHKKFEEAAVS